MKIKNQTYLVASSALLLLASQSNAALEEVVVTATKRAETIQDVPVSVTAVSADMMEKVGISAAGRFRPTADLIYLAVADEESGSAHGARWMADHHPDAMRADYVLTENGGLHSGSSDAPFVGVNIAEKGVAWRKLTVRGTPGHGSMPFRKDNALVNAAGVVQRLADYRPAPRFTELWGTRVATLGLPDDVRGVLLD